MMVERWRRHEGAVRERRNSSRISCWRSLMVTLAAWPGIDLLHRAGENLRSLGNILNQVYRWRADSAGRVLHAGDGAGGLRRPARRSPEAPAAPDTPGGRAG